MSQDFVQIYEPVNTLKEVAKNVWIVDGSIVKMSMYGTQIPFPTRMTIIKLDNGGLWCHLDLRMTFLGNKKQAYNSFEKMMEWQPEKIILAHGRWYDKNGSAELKRAFCWLK